MKNITRSAIVFAIAAGVATVVAQGNTQQARLNPGPPQQATLQTGATSYFPARDRWESRKPEDVGMDPVLLAQAVEYAKTRDTTWAKVDYMADQVQRYGRPLGKLPPSHGPTNGVILRHGYIVAEFGDTSVVEPTYSVAKSYLSTVLGLAVDRGLVKSVTDPVGAYVKDGGYDSPHNAKITWEHHARQASEWEGTMFGKPSTFLGREEFGDGEMKPRAIQEPGSYYEYNDVRVNRLALSLLRVWKRPLPDVLKTEIMDPIGASDTWQWLGYDNADVQVDGKTMRSVPGGTRWGAGLWMNSRDHARYGLLMARMGKWKGRQLVSESWIRQATTRGGPANDYGFLWWLNTKGGYAGLPTSSYQAQGNGSNTIFVDPEHDLVIVWRWHARGDFFARVVASIKS